jgi:hypothetical protein
MDIWHGQTLMRARAILGRRWRTIRLDHRHHGFQREFAIPNHSHVGAHNLVDILGENIKVDDATSTRDGRRLCSRSEVRELSSHTVIEPHTQT